MSRKNFRKVGSFNKGWFGTTTFWVVPDGSLAGMARAAAGGLLQPKLVFDAAG